MQSSLIALTLALAASVVAVPAQAASNNLDRRQNVGLGGVCSARTDCADGLACVSAGGSQICSKNLGVGQFCVENAVSVPIPVLNH